MESDARATILDYIDNISVPGDVFREPANEYFALVFLQHGMEFLYHQTRRSEMAVIQQTNPDGDVDFFGAGNHPAFAEVPQTLLTCAFHWYAISACQYVRTVGAIAKKLDSNRPLPRDYAMGIIPEVIAFRDKVAAHFSWTTENRRDNDAERLASILPQLGFIKDSYYVSPWTVALRRGDKSSQSNAIKPWSLCKVHQVLRERYWQDEQSTAL